MPKSRRSICCAGFFIASFCHFLYKEESVEQEKTLRQEGKAWSDHERNFAEKGQKEDKYVQIHHQC